MSFPYHRILKARRSLLRSAINDTLGFNALKSRPSANFYAEILGYQSNNHLEIESMKSPAKALFQFSLTHEYPDWDIVQFKQELLEKYLPEMTFEQFQLAETKVRLLWRPNFSQSWFDIVSKHLNELNDLRYLSRFELIKQLSNMLCYMRNSGYGEFCRYLEVRLILIIQFLLSSAEKNQTTKVTFDQLRYLLEPTPFALLKKYLAKNLNFYSSESNGYHILQDYIRKDSTLFGSYSKGQYLESINSLNPVFDRLCKGDSLESLNREFKYMLMQQSA